MAHFTLKKPYWLLIFLIGVIALDWYIRAPDATARHITHVLQDQGSPQLKSYPYQFWVMKVDHGVATLSTPRNTDVPAAKMLAALYPKLDTQNPNDPAFQAAEHQLAAVQGEARAIVLSQPGIKEVQWGLDKDWLHAHFIELPEDRPPTN